MQITGSLYYLRFMKSFFDPATKDLVLARLEKLTPASQPIWGKMNSAQMMAHATAVLESATDQALPRKQLFIGKLFMLFMKNDFANDKPWRKNSPTAPGFLMADEKDFAKEKQRLIEIINRFHQGGTSKVTKHPSVFWGQRSPEEWGIGMYKHTDHHFQQFGI
jgi:hypothetical protein